VGSRSPAARALAYWRKQGGRRFARLVAEVFGDYVSGLVAPLGRASRELPVLSRPSQDGLPEIVLLGLIEWAYRFQRPQQLCHAWARVGCRVHYCAPFSNASWGRGWRMRPLGHDGRLWHVRFFTPNLTSVDDLTSSNVSAACFAYGLQRLVDQMRGNSPVVLIAENPFWDTVLQNIRGAHIIYDCLDDFTDFSHARPETARREMELVDRCHAVVSTADHLATRWRQYALPQAVIRNACDYEHFSVPPPRLYPVPPHKPVIGYHGALENWFDMELVEAVARAYPHCTVLLVGGGDKELTRSLRLLPNVILPGEVSYADLPQYVHTFTVALLPFRIQPLTLGTNPVKMYEYLAAGLPVVAVPLPEMAQFGNLVEIASGEDFVKAVGRQLDRCHDDADKRRAFARAHSWDERAKAFLDLCNDL